MDDKYVFQKTRQEIGDLGAHAGGLSPKHLRCLILVDGRKSVRHLAAYFRPGELAALLRELVERGFLDAPPEGVEAIEGALAKVNLIDEARFLDIQRRAMEEMARRLGPAGKPYATQIGACARPEQLRIALRSLEKLLQAHLGADGAGEFVMRVGQELMG